MQSLDPAQPHPEMVVISGSFMHAVPKGLGHRTPAEERAQPWIQTPLPRLLPLPPAPAWHLSMGSGFPARLLRFLSP